jgi:hypothetical protein
MGKEKLIDAEIQLKIKELLDKEAGMSCRQISAQLGAQGITISYPTIFRYMNKVKQQGIELAAKDALLNKAIINIVGNIKMCDAQMRKMVEDMKVTKTFKISAIKQLMEITRMVMDYERTARQIGGVVINQAPGSQIQFVQDYKIYLHDLESRGDITILNPMLKSEGQPKPMTLQAEVIDMVQEIPGPLPPISEEEAKEEEKLEDDEEDGEH